VVSGSVVGRGVLAKGVVLGRGAQGRGVQVVVSPAPRVRGLVLLLVESPAPKVNILDTGAEDSGARTLQRRR